MQAREDGGVKTFVEQLGPEVLQHLFGFGKVFPFEVGIQAEEADAAEQFAFAAWT